MSEHNDTEPHHAASPTEHVLTELQLYGWRPYADKPDPRPLPEGEHVAGAVADIFDALIATMGDTRLEPDLDDLLWSVTNVFHRAVLRIERELDDNEQAQRRLQREQDGSEIKAVELENLTAQGQTMIERRDAFELMRDQSAEHYEQHTGSAWRPRTGSMVNHRHLTAAMIDSRDFLAARRKADTEVMLPAGPKIALTGGLDFNDHKLIWDALDKVHAKHNDMVLLHGKSPKGAELIAAKWADSRKVLGKAMISEGSFRYTGLLHTDVTGGGISGVGSRRSFLMTDTSLERHIAVITGTTGTQFIGFQMIGPHIFDGPDGNRGIVIGVETDLTTIASAPWDAVGTWVDDVVTRGLCVGLQISWAANIAGGTLEVYEAGDSRDEPGSYGITTSGSGLRLQRLVATNTMTVGRHALYYTGPANDNFVEDVYAQGWALAAIQNRAREGGGHRNGYGRATIVECNVEGGWNSAAINFITVADEDLTTTSYPLIGDTTFVGCSGRMVQIRKFAAPQYGRLEVLGHTGIWPDANHYLVYNIDSPQAGLPDLIAIEGLGSDGLNDSTLRGLVVHDSPKSTGGSVRMNGVYERALDMIASSGTIVPMVYCDGTYQQAVNFNNTLGGAVGSAVCDGTYSVAARFSAAANFCRVDAVTPLSAPTSALLTDASSGSRRNLVMRAPGYDVLDTSDAPTIKVAGYRSVRVTHGVPTDVSNLPDIQNGQRVRFICMNANTTFIDSAVGAGSIEFSNNVDRNPAARKGFVLDGFVTGDGTSVVVSAIEAASS